MAVTPQQATDAWVQGMQSASAKIQRGLEGVTESPTAKAAQNLDKYLNNTQMAVSSGKMASKLNAVSLQDWKTATLAKVSRVGPGATAAAPKMARFMQKWIPFVLNVKAQVRAMPSATVQDRINRMVANATMLSQFKGQ